MNFSRRKLAQPLPPLPAMTVISASSTNFICLGTGECRLETWDSGNPRSRDWGVGTRDSGLGTRDWEKQQQKHKSVGRVERSETHQSPSHDIPHTKNHPAAGRPKTTREE